MNKEKILNCLNNILELELAGVVRYTHYAFMVQGPYRLSVVDWLREQAKESLMHAEMVGEHITSLGEHPTLKIGELLETHKHSNWLKLHPSLVILFNISDPIFVFDFILKCVL